MLCPAWLRAIEPLNVLQTRSVLAARGEVAEWFMALVLKTSVRRKSTVGSNPTLSANSLKSRDLVGYANPRYRRATARKVKCGFESQCRAPWKIAPSAS
jgi:hypothetical protein